jgi:hypothetical protein
MLPYARSAEGGAVQKAHSYSKRGSQTQDVANGKPRPKANSKMNSADHPLVISTISAQPFGTHPSPHQEPAVEMQHRNP